MDKRAVDDRLELYVAGELPAEQQRELAQAALDDPALFDTLTAAALLTETLHGGEPAPATTTAARRSPRGRRAILAGVGLAAAAVIAWLVVGRPAPDSRDTAAAPTQTRARAPVEPAASAAPVFLTAQLGDADGRPSAFRSVESGSRLPKEAGVVVSSDNGEIEIDVGSLDGLENGSVLRLSPQDGRGGGATLHLDAVFRERSRGYLTAGTVQPGDSAEVPRAAYVIALLDHANARAAAGSITPARRLAELAVARAGAADTPSDVRRRALAGLGALEHRAGALEEAARHLRLAVAELEATPAPPPAEQFDLLDELAAVLVERREFADAEPILRAAEPHASGRAAARVANNLGAIAALRGDRAAAESLYRSALDQAAASPAFDADARVIRANLAALDSSR